MTLLLPTVNFASILKYTSFTPFPAQTREEEVARMALPSLPSHQSKSINLTITYVKPFLLVVLPSSLMHLSEQGIFVLKIPHS